MSGKRRSAGDGLEVSCGGCRNLCNQYVDYGRLGKKHSRVKQLDLARTVSSLVIGEELVVVNFVPSGCGHGKARGWEGVGWRYILTGTDLKGPITKYRPIESKTSVKKPRKRLKCRNQACGCSDTLD